MPPQRQAIVYNLQDIWGRPPPRINSIRKRTCKFKNCITKLSTYNTGTYCGIHKAKIILDDAKNNTTSDYNKNKSTRGLKTYKNIKKRKQRNIGAIYWRLGKWDVSVSIKNTRFYFGVYKERSVAMKVKKEALQWVINQLRTKKRIGKRILLKKRGELEKKHKRGATEKLSLAITLMCLFSFFYLSL